MKQEIAIKRLNDMELKGRYVFLHRDLMKIFNEDSDKAFSESLARLVKTGILERAARGLYVYGLSQYKNSSQTIELIAKNLRRGEYNYVSLESALSEYGVISQIPMNRVTVMTTGRKGEYKSRFGVIEFTHTKRSVTDIVSNIHNVGRPLRMASKKVAYRDLKRVGRNIHLVDEDILNED